MNLKAREKNTEHAMVWRATEHRFVLNREKWHMSVQLECLQQEDEGVFVLRKSERTQVRHVYCYE